MILAATLATCWPGCIRSVESAFRLRVPMLPAAATASVTCTMCICVVFTCRTLNTPATRAAAGAGI